MHLTNQNQAVKSKIFAFYPNLPNKTTNIFCYRPNDVASVPLYSMFVQHWQHIERCCKCCAQGKCFTGHFSFSMLLLRIDAARPKDKVQEIMGATGAITPLEFISRTWNQWPNPKSRQCWKLHELLKNGAKNMRWVRTYRIALKFRGSKFSRISRITGHSRNKLFQRKF